MKKIKRKRSYFNLLNPKLLRVLLSLGVKGYFAERGWIDSFLKQSAVDGKGNSIPWTTYGYLDFIQDRLSPQHTVFEYGAGNSTLYYAKKVAKVVAVEHDIGWYEKLSSIKPDHVEINHCPLEQDGDYCRYAVRYGQKFQLIMIDGRDRVNCCKQAVRALTPDGVIVLDDSERKDYAAGIAFLEDSGFKHLPFTGLAPGAIIDKQTSIFYKPGNCLNI